MAGEVDVAQHERGPVEPIGHPQRGEIGHEVDVPVAEVPPRELVAGNRLHLEVGGEQVVAAVGAVAGDLVEEEVGGEALAAEPSVVVGEAGDDRVDATGGGAAGELVEGQHPEGPVRHRRTLPPVPSAGPHG